jgi:hypothetical protein
MLAFSVIDCSYLRFHTLFTRGPKVRRFCWPQCWQHDDLDHRKEGRAGLGHDDERLLKIVRDPQQIEAAGGLSSIAVEVTSQYHAVVR